MKCRKSLWFCLVVMLTLSMASGCSWKKYEYPFSQSLKYVEKVEIWQYDYDEISPKITSLMALDNDTADSLLTDVASLDCYRYFGEPSFAYGEVVLYITYAGAEAEVVEPHTSAQIDKNGTWHPTGYFFLADEFYTAILKYVDSDLLPDLSKYFE